MLLDKVQEVCQKQTLKASWNQESEKRRCDDRFIKNTSLLVMETTDAGKIEDKTVDELEK